MSSQDVHRSVTFESRWMTNQRSVRASRRSAAASERVLTAAHDDAPGTMVKAAPKGTVTSPLHRVIYAAIYSPPAVHAPASPVREARGRITSCVRGYYIIGSHTSRFFLKQLTVSPTPPSLPPHPNAHHRPARGPGTVLATLAFSRKPRVFCHDGYN